LIGEVGLGGQVRPVLKWNCKKAKLGFKRAMYPRVKLPRRGFEIIPVAKVIDAIIAAIPPQHQESEMPDLDD